MEELVLSNNVAVLTGAQLGGFDLIQGNFGVDRLTLAAAGTADLTGAQIGGIDEIRGTNGNDGVILTGVAAGQLVNGLDGNDTLTGGDGADVLNGGNQNDGLTGGLGLDQMNGGAGVDTFDFNDVTESPAGPNRGVIAGFVHGQDVIHLADIDANSEVGGDQAFAFLGGDGFTGVAGQLRYSAGNLLGDIDGDSVAEFQIALAGAPVVTGSDLIP